MAPNSANTSDIYDDQEPNAAIEAPADSTRTDVKRALEAPQSGSVAEVLKDNQINLSGYEYDGYTIHHYSQKRGTVSVMDYRNKNDRVFSFEIPIADLAAAMKAKRESMLPSLKKGQTVMAMASNGELREGWNYRRHPSDPDAVVLVGKKDGLQAYVTYPNVAALKQEIVMVETVAEYTKKDFELFSTASGDVEGGWRVTHIIDPKTNKLRVFNERTGEEKFFDSVDHLLIEVHAAGSEDRSEAKLAQIRERHRIEDKIPHHMAYTVMAGTNLLAPVRTKADKYRGRTRISSTSGDIDGQVYMPKAVEEIQEAIVVDTEKDPILGAYINEIFQYLAPKWHRKDLTPEQALRMIAQKIQDDFPYKQEMCEKQYALDEGYLPGKKHYLGNFMKSGGKDSNMVCRHMGLLAAIIIEKIKADPQYNRLLPADLRSNFMGDQSELKNDRSGHAYAIVASPSPQGMKYYYLDPAGGVAMKEIGVDLMKHDMSKSEARYLFSLLRTVFNEPDPVHTSFLERVFTAEKNNPALRKIARNALYATRDPDARAAVRAFRKRMGLSKY